MNITIQSNHKRKRHLKILTTTLDTYRYKVYYDNISSLSGMVKIFRQNKSPHLLVIQDDVIVCKDFVKTVEYLVKLLPDKIISFFTRFKSSKQFLVTDRLYGACSYVIPQKDINEFLEFYPKLKYIKADDIALSRFIEETGKEVWITNPSLVQHIAFDSSSLHNDKIRRQNILDRVAFNYIGTENSGLDIDWDINNKEYRSLAKKSDFIMR